MRRPILHDLQSAHPVCRYLIDLVGIGPPNRYCMSLFPPSWRLDDWYVGRWVTLTNDFNPFGLLIAGIVIFGIGGIGGTCACLKSRQVGAELGQFTARVANA